MTTVKVGKIWLLIAASLMVLILFLAHFNAPVYAKATCDLVLTHEATVQQFGIFLVEAELICFKKNGTPQRVKEQTILMCLKYPPVPDDGTPLIVGSCYGLLTGTVSEWGGNATSTIGIGEISATIPGGRYEGLSDSSTYEVISFP